MPTRSFFLQATLIELKLEKFADTEVKSAVSLKVSRLMRIPGCGDEAEQFHLSRHDPNGNELAVSKRTPRYLSSGFYSSFLCHSSSSFFILIEFRVFCRSRWLTAKALELNVCGLSSLVVRQNRNTENFALQIDIEMNSESSKRFSENRRFARPKSSCDSGHVRDVSKASLPSQFCWFI